MTMVSPFSFSRWWGIIIKEFLQLKRDRITFAMMVVIPIIQLALFGFAINTDPKHLPTAIISYDKSEFTRTMASAMQTSQYYKIMPQYTTPSEAQEALQKGEILFILTIPSDFSRKLLRGEKPSLLLEADATDPVTVSTALLSIEGIATQVAKKDLTGPLSGFATLQKPFDVRVHRLYNPDGINQYNIIPGLMGTLMTMTLTMMTALAITRERERGTMENLLSTPAKPLEIMTGKIIPYIIIGLLQATLILCASYFVFHVPFNGSIFLAYGVALLFIAVNLTIGITISSLAQNMLQALQLTIFYFLPSIMLSGFMFPFSGMPSWAQHVGELLPLTYFNRLIRGVVLKGSDFATLWPNIWPLMVICTVMMFFAVKFYKKTLD
ncbi:ABC transporter permease [Sulfuricurvum sp.]|uniref:ABC transporter permease n=1 Tax=Sulfuricurvum sp. TaxID=2025608 RepID=UPI002601A0C7|nr:ABC transporter permease [Sulfuricurvum sp.]MDD4949975.1 ABC transporter permease [Sulfuricurvum sp.]